MCRKLSAPHCRILCPVGQDSGPMAHGVWRPSPGPWWSMRAAFWTRSSHLLAKIDEPWSIDHKIRVLVDEQSTGGLTIEALSRPDSATSSTSTRCGTRT